MTNYDRGRAFEYDTRDRLVGDGYWVMRSAGSKGKVDILAIKDGHTLFVQCKADGKCSPAERAELLRIAALIDGLPIVAYRDRGVRFRLLNGPGPAQWVPWSPDEIEESAS